MTVTFRRAVRENVGLLVGLMGASGSGKTWTGMEMASGIMDVLAPGKPFAVIDTEASRAKHYAEHFAFDHADLKPPFRPSVYADAIEAADKAHYPVIVVDSFSHEHAGAGGILDWQEEELTAAVARAQKREDRRSEWELRESFKMSAWIKPKTDHKKMVQRLLQVRAHLILCFRAEEKIEMIKNKEGRWEVQPKQSAVGLRGWIPICEKNLPYELTASFLLTADRPGVPNPIKLQKQHRELFPVDQPITREAGRRLAAWARGNTSQSAVKPISAPVAVEPPPPTTAPPEGSDGLFTPPQTAETVAEIQRLRDSLERPVPEKVWAALCLDICNAEPSALESVDPSALSDLRALLVGIKAKDRASIQRANAIAKKIPA